MGKDMLAIQIETRAVFDDGMTGDTVRKNSGNLKKIPAESQLTSRYHQEKTDMLVAGCYRD